MKNGHFHNFNTQKIHSFNFNLSEKPFAFCADAKVGHWNFKTTFFHKNINSESLLDLWDFARFPFEVFLRWKFISFGDLKVFRCFDGIKLANNSMLRQMKFRMVYDFLYKIFEFLPKKPSELSQAKNLLRIKIGSKRKRKAQEKLAGEGHTKNITGNSVMFLLALT